MTRTLLIDADLIAYRASAALQQEIDWNGDGFCVSMNGREKEAKKAAEDTVDQMMDKLKGDDLIVCLSDEVENFRKDIDPTYKASRGGTERPVHLYDVKEHLGSVFPSRLLPRLEADDVMGIMATEPHKGERVMVSLDKDMKTIPGLLCRPPLKAGDKWEIVESSEEEANRFHLWQTLAGDTVDGYPGCAGCGPKGADAILSGKVFEDQGREITRGPRKGQWVPAWRLVDDEEGLSDWQRVCNAYARFGQTEEAALRQARLAFILRDGFLQGRQVRLWKPAI
ncbi:hypothetical protein QQS45_08395 [Alteriqipengyuania flavescens]|uniref:hypothetical protein n=1 Tax=Alteriqipengyuania flavescens TaxID=3053610 RepID=UPI0025B2A526|nr:hypothetical protein [Alteriqipengyuania flavescens]WJY17666.1 hypothetical protein QQW98_08390 [Alteriqipengyuania flavescens]WJY23609.1 hypothetical protein QQS45_08395 [Alteriqipengyuania flavescens]